jgi:NitT/TauT family transport system permease protein
MEFGFSESASCMDKTAMQIGSTRKTRFSPITVFAACLCLWAMLSALRIFPESAFPSPMSVARGFSAEIKSGRLINDLIASLFRVTAGFTLAALLGIPLGLVLGHASRARVAFLPVINFFRNLSPLAWIPFAILWFGIGDAPAIFLIFIASFFPITLAAIAAVATIPKVYFRVAQDYHFKGIALVMQITLPAIAPQIITSLRVTAGVAWMVVVAAEMIAGRDGLGFAIWDARNGLRMDLLVVGMISIGMIGALIDQILARLTKIRSVRWGYER